MYFLIGASGHSKVIIEILESCGAEIYGISDSNQEISILNEYPVSNDSSLKYIDPKIKVILAIGNNTIRKKLAETLDCNYGNAIHPSSIVSKRLQIGIGNVIMAGVCINSGVEIADHCILNTGSIVEHDCKIGKFVHLSPNCALAGNVTIGEGTHIGIGACIIQGVKIGSWVTIGAGSVIIEDVPDYAVVVGVPGKIIKYNIKNEG